MALHQIWTMNDPVLRDLRREENEARAATVYASVGRLRRGLMNGAGHLVAALRRAHLRRRTYRLLSELGDEALADIGLSRHELGDVAGLVAEDASGDGLTLATLRGRSDRAREAAVLPFGRREQSPRPPHDLPAERAPDAA